MSHLQGGLLSISRRKDPICPHLLFSGFEENFPSKSFRTSSSSPICVIILQGSLTLEYELASFQAEFSLGLRLGRRAALAVEGTGDWHGEELRSLPLALSLRTGTMSSVCGERMLSQSTLANTFPFPMSRSLGSGQQSWGQLIFRDHKATRQDADALFPDFPGSQISSPQRDLAPIQISTPSQLHPHIICFLFFFFFIFCFIFSVAFTTP